MRFKNKIGVLGGSFDPAHIGHLAISKKALKVASEICVFTNNNVTTEKV